MSKTVIIIPARLSAKRLPNKPLLKINDIPMIVQVYKRAVEADIGEVYVATPDKEIENVIKEHNGKSIFTGINHMTGTDRVYEAYKKINSIDFDMIINLQGDMPNINPDNIVKLNDLMKNEESKIGTLAGQISDIKELKDFNVVKLKTKEPLDNKNFLQAEDFFRTIEFNSDINIYHHIGIYAFKSEILEKYINLKRSKNELDRNLEQMRALDNNIQIKVTLVQSIPLSVDTLKDFNEVKSLMNLKK